MVKLIFFADRYSLDKYDKQPLPVDIYNSEGAIMAHKGQKLSKQRLLNTYIYEDDMFVSDEIDLDEDISEILKFVESEKGGESSKVSETPEMSIPLEEISSEDISYELSERFEEESAEKIDERLSEIDFEPLPEVKMNLRKNIYQMKEMFQKQIIEDTTKLVSKNNEKLSGEIASYLETIIEKNLYASDYMDMVNSIRTKDNYLSFSHSCSVAFYALAIIKKLKMIREDMFDSPNYGKWLPIKTAKNRASDGALDISNQLLKYIDYQKDILRIKYSDPVRSILIEGLNDVIYEYGKIDSTKNYPSMNIDFDISNRRTVAMAGLNHDIGKICIPDRVLNKKGRLTYEEFRMMEKHPAYSVAKLKELGVNNSNLFAYILGHHRLSPERGYPPVRKTPPIESKIIAIADIYDGMRSPKYYGHVCSQADALSYLRDLYEEGCFDFPLYLAAIHTFDEYNHMFVERRKKVTVESVL